MLKLIINKENYNSELNKTDYHIFTSSKITTLV